MDYNIFMFINNYDFDETIEKEWASPVMYDGITNIEHYKKLLVPVENRHSVTG